MVALGEAYRAYAHAHPGLYAAVAAVGPSKTLELNAAPGVDGDGRRGVLRPFGLVAEEEVLHALRAFYSLMHGFVSLEAAGGFALPLDPALSFHWLLAHFSVGLEGCR